MPVLLIESVVVGDGELEALVRVSEERYMRTSAVAELPARVSALLPDLARHSCINDDHTTFADEIRDTETPHLLEHVTLELMSMAGSPRWLRGETRWDFSADGHGVFRVRLAYDDDLVAVGALRAGVEVIDWLFDSGPRPPVNVIAARLRAVRRRES